MLICAAKEAILQLLYAEQHCSREDHEGEHGVACILRTKSQNSHDIVEIAEMLETPFKH